MVVDDGFGKRVADGVCSDKGSCFCSTLTTVVVTGLPLMIVVVLVVVVVVTILPDVAKELTEESVFFRLENNPMLYAAIGTGSGQVLICSTG